VIRVGSVLILAAAIAAGACGKRGNPLPPLRPLPAAIRDLSVKRVDGRIELTFAIPTVNADGTTPVAIDRVEVHAVPVMPGITPKTAPQMLEDSSTLRTTLQVRTPVETDSAAPAPARVESAANPAPGERALVVDNPSAIAGPGATAINYVVAGVVGGGRGRKGPASPVVSVSLAEPPPPPASLTLAHDERAITVTWPRVSGQQVLVFDTHPRATTSAPTAPAAGALPAAGAPPATSVPAAPRQLTPSPVGTFAFTEPVEFGVERCYTVRSVRVTGAASVLGPASPEACITPVDKYPPPSPSNLQVLQEGQAVTLNWTSVEAPDLAGYVVLRGEGAGEAMRPLVRTPLAGTTFSDTSVVPGATYTYSVYAVDTAPIPNVSQQSQRRSVTVR
jgi:hypothetical protein